jgi:pilus assembly protein CpaB
MAAKPRAVFIIGGIAVVVALIAAFAVWDYMRTQEDRLERMKQEALATEEVVVAAAEIPTGTVISPTAVKTVEWPKVNLPPGAILSTDNATGRVALLTIKPGDPITDAKLIPLEGPSGILSYKIPEGHRAMTVGVNQVSGVAGFINPGNKVDVVLTTTPPGLDEPISKIILQDVPVLATGQVIEQPPEGEPQIVPTVTLDLTPEDTERLALASNQGTLQLLLRRVGEAGEVKTMGATVGSVIEDFKVAKKKKRKVVRRKVVKKKPTVAKAVMEKKEKVGPEFVTVPVEVLRNGEKTIETFKVKREELL